MPPCGRPGGGKLLPYAWMRALRSRRGISRTPLFRRTATRAVPAVSVGDGRQLRLTGSAGDVERVIDDLRGDIDPGGVDTVAELHRVVDLVDLEALRRLEKIDGDNPA